MASAHPASPGEEDGKNRQGRSHRLQPGWEKALSGAPTAGPARRGGDLLRAGFPRGPGLARQSVRLPGDFLRQRAPVPPRRSGGPGFPGAPARDSVPQALLRLRSLRQGPVEATGERGARGHQRQLQPAQRDHGVRRGAGAQHPLRQAFPRERAWRPPHRLHALGRVRTHHSVAANSGQIRFCRDHLGKKQLPKPVCTRARRARPLPGTRSGRHHAVHPQGALRLRHGPGRKLRRRRPPGAKRAGQRPPRPAGPDSGNPLRLPAERHRRKAAHALDDRPHLCLPHLHS